MANEYANMIRNPARMMYGWCGRSYSPKEISEYVCVLGEVGVEFENGFEVVWIGKEVG